MEAVVFSSVVATDSCYFVTGIIADTIPPYYRTSALFLKLDLEGNVLKKTMIKDTARTYELWFPNLQWTNDEKHLVVGVMCL